MRLAGFCLGWQLRQSRLSLVCPGSPVQPQARLGQVGRQGESRDGPTPAAARALGQEGEVGYPREGRGSGFCFFLHLCLPPLPPVCLCPLRLLRHGYQDCEGIRLIPFLFWFLYLPWFLKQWIACGASTRGQGLRTSGSENLFLFPFPFPPPPLPCPPPSPSRALPPSLPSPSFWAGPCSGYMASSAPNAASASARMTS